MGREAQYSNVLHTSRRGPLPLRRVHPIHGSSNLIWWQQTKSFHHASTMLSGSKPDRLCLVSLIASFAPIGLVHCQGRRMFLKDLNPKRLERGRKLCSAPMLHRRRYKMDTIKVTSSPDDSSHQLCYFSVCWPFFRSCCPYFIIVIRKFAELQPVRALQAGISSLKMKLSRVLSRTHSQEDLTLRKHTPWIASPLERDEAENSSEHNTPPHNAKHTTAHEKALHFDLPHHHHDRSLPPFKRHHESSTIELFYDLFFVANLASFTVNHEIVNADSLKNYIGFFTILWFTWLETTLFDVRFATDSVFDRICKAISFGVMTGFAVCGAIYDTSHVGENVKAFRALALILMVSRLGLVVQYGVVLYYVREYRKTMAPMLATMGTLFLSAMIFLGTFWGYHLKDTGDSFPNQEGGPETYIAYYIVVCFEATAVITISCVWRVISFKRTHLVCSLEPTRSSFCSLHPLITTQVVLLMSFASPGRTYWSSYPNHHGRRHNRHDQVRLDDPAKLHHHHLLQRHRHHHLLRPSHLLHLGPLLRPDRARPLRHHPPADLGDPALPPARLHLTDGGGKHGADSVE